MHGARVLRRSRSTLLRPRRHGPRGGHIFAADAPRVSRDPAIDRAGGALAGGGQDAAPAAAAPGRRRRPT